MRNFYLMPKDISKIGIAATSGPQAAQKHYRKLLLVSNKNPLIQPIKI